MLSGQIPYSSRRIIPDIKQIALELHRKWINLYIYRLLCAIMNPSHGGDLDSTWEFGAVWQVVALSHVKMSKALTAKNNTPAYAYAA